MVFFITVFVHAASEKSGEQSILQIEKDIAEVYGKITVNNQSIAFAQKQISDIHKNINDKKKYLAQRLLAQKSVKSMSWFLALDTKNKVILDRNLKIFKNINSSDVAALYEYKLALEELKNQESFLESENQSLIVLTKYLVDQEEKLKSAEQEQIALLEKLRNMEHLLNYKGKLSLPVKTSVIEGFGSSHDGNNQYALLVKGLVIDGQGKQVVSAFGPGKVIFRDHIPYWGDSLIISHKGGYYSVYAGVENVLVKVDSVVVNEQAIAYTNGKEFYFELRHLNIPLNPLSWIRKNHE
jgi:septal ring factor EnvC (AmiA/AmiB activator)